MATLISKFWPYISLAIILALLTSFAAGYYKGHVDTESKITTVTLVKEVHDVKVQSAIEKKVMALPDLDLDSRLSKWMRD